MDLTSSSERIAFGLPLEITILLFASLGNCLIGLTLTAGQSPEGEKFRRLENQTLFSQLLTFLSSHLPDTSGFSP
jgi:hypothetical protein